jgi:hypothetical protein
MKIPRNRILAVAADILRKPTAARFGDRAYMEGLYRDTNAAVNIDIQKDVSEHHVNRFIDALVAAGSLVRAQRNLYVNKMATPSVHPNEAAAVIRKGAIVSLGTVLGEVGVAHNPSRVVSAVIPSTSPQAVDPHRVDNEFGEYQFLVMREDRMTAGAEQDRLDPASRYARATPERAFCDWLYFASSQVRSRRLSQPPLDFDLSDLDLPRLRRLADVMELSDDLKEWLHRKAQADADPEASEKFSAKLGF